MGCRCSKATQVNEHGPTDTLASDLVQHFFVQDINEHFKFHEQLGKGAFGFVTRATNLKTSKNWAIKIVDLSNAVDKDALRNEINMLKRLQHPNIVRVVSSYEDNERMYMVMQLCTGRELFDHLYKEKKAFSEKEVAGLIRNLLRAVAYLHANQITHRDMKLENLLLENDSETATLKVCDFGFSKFIKPGERLTKALGTVDYVSPEVLVGDYNEKCDIWSVGVIAYELIAGKSPFRGKTQDETMSNILDAQLGFQEPIWSDISPRCKAFIKSLVREEPEDRCSAIEALEHPWLSIDKVIQLDAEQKQHVIDTITKFSQSRQMKQTALLSLALGADDHVDEPFLSRDVFHQMDLDQTGTIDIDEFCIALTGLGLERAEAERLFASVDQTKSKTINYLEFLAATMSQKHLDETALKEAFHRLDTTKTGRISVQGLSDLLKRLFDADEVRTMIESADIKGDGCLDYDEFKAMFDETPSSEAKQVVIELNN